jgi:hypothetical protein
MNSFNERPASDLKRFSRNPAAAHATANHWIAKARAPVAVDPVLAVTIWKARRTSSPTQQGMQQ